MIIPEIQVNVNVTIQTGDAQDQAAREGIAAALRQIQLKGRASAEDLNQIADQSRQLVALHVASALNDPTDPADRKRLRREIDRYVKRHSAGRPRRG